MKKLMENFGEEAPKSGGEQLTIDDVTEKSTHKVYRCRNGKKEEAPGEAPEGMPDDKVSEMLLKSIRDAERFASGMKETEEEPEEPEEPEGRAKDTAETEDEEPAEELPAVAFEPSDIPNPEKDRMAAEKVLVQTEKAEEPEKRFEEEPEEPFAGVQEKPAEPETEKDGREESEPEEVLFRSGAESPDLQKEEAGVTAEEESEELQELQEPQEPEEPEEPEKSEESQEPQETGGTGVDFPPESGTAGFPGAGADSLAGAGGEGRGKGIGNSGGGSPGGTCRKGRKIRRKRSESDDDLRNGKRPGKEAGEGRSPEAAQSH